VRIIGRLLDPDEPVAALGQDDYWRFREARAKAVRSPASANVTCRYLKAALNRALRDGLIERLPFRVELLPSPPKRNRALTRVQVNKVLAKAYDPRAHALLTIAYGLGLRLSEILHLWWGDVDLQEAWLQVEAKPGWSPKTRQRRVVVLDEDLVKYLLDWRARLCRTGPTDPIVPRDMQNGAPFTRRWAGELLAEVFRTAGVKGGVHSLRHTMVTEALPVHVVQRMAGHAAGQTTLGHYAHVRDAALREAAVLLARRRRGGG
jgi:integrase/recombinase XerD